MTQNKQFDAIIQALKQFPNGASLEDILVNSQLELSKRSLQRRLLQLQQMQRVIIEGKTRATRYFVQPGNTQTNNTLMNKTYGTIQLSTAAEKLQQQVSAPLASRTPVSYNKNLLQCYQPNVSRYLSDEDIGQLTAIGQTTKPSHPAGTYAKDIFSRLLIDLSWNSSRLEGNTYSLLDTQRLLNFGQTFEQGNTLETQMILNHKDAIEFLVQNATQIEMNRYSLLNLHGLLSYNLLPDPMACGRLRYIAVGIGHSVYQPLSVADEIAAMFDLLLHKASSITNPFEQAFFIMVHLPYLQPFDDVNKRVSRLACNMPLIKHNLVPLSFIDVSNELYINATMAVYELNQLALLKELFIWAYQRSAARYGTIRQSIGEPDPFRLEYREKIRQLISHIVATPLSGRQAIKHIEQQAQTLPEPVQRQFIEVTQTELLSLHEGNFARYHVRPSQFEAWQQLWREG